ncbi:MAG TPA: twin-arginine translocase TatA/TatE family subunit [Myxococcaceae bacterium]|nr:twin-arginine translocase TatA/TatE family subunit [Myxococcaceae bacterium]
MLNVGPGEVILILVVALLILGPKRLPELARGLGKFMREIRRQTDEVRSVVEREFYRMDQDLNTEANPAELEGQPNSILPVQAPRPPAALMAVASQPTNPGSPGPASAPGAPPGHGQVTSLRPGAPEPPDGTVPARRERPTLVPTGNETNDRKTLIPTGSDPEDGA